MKWVVFIVGLLLLTLSHASKIPKAQRLPELAIAGKDINELAKEVEIALKQDEEALEKSAPTGQPPGTSQTPDPATSAGASSTAAATTAKVDEKKDEKAASSTATVAETTVKVEEEKDKTKVDEKKDEEKDKKAASSTAAATTAKVDEKKDEKAASSTAAATTAKVDEDKDEEKEEPKNATQDVSFDKNFDATIPMGTKDDFLDECSKKMNTLGCLCIDVKKGSVVITIGGTTAKVKKATKFLSENSFALESFGDLGKGVKKGDLQQSDLEFPELPMPGIPLDPTMTTKKASATSSAAPKASTSAPQSSQPAETKPAPSTSAAATTSAAPGTSTSAPQSSQPAETKPAPASSSAASSSSSAPATSSSGAPPATSGAPPSSTGASTTNSEPPASSAAPTQTAAPQSSSAAATPVISSSAPAETSGKSRIPQMPKLPNVPDINFPQVPNVTLPSIPGLPSVPKLGNLTGNYSLPSLPFKPPKMPNITLPTIKIEFHDWEVLMDKLLQQCKDGKLFGINIPWGIIRWWGVCVVFIFFHMFLQYNHYKVYDSTYKHGRYTAFIKILLAIKLVYVLSYTIYLISTRNFGGEWWQCIVGFLCYFFAGFLELMGGPYCKVLCNRCSVPCFLIWLPFLNWIAFVYAVAIFSFVQLGLTCIHIGVLCFNLPEGLEMMPLLG